MSVQRLTPPTDNQWARDFIDRGRGLHAEIALSALRVILKSVISGLVSVISVVLSTVNPQSQAQFVSVSLRPVLRTLTARVTATTVRSSRGSLLHLVGPSLSLRQLIGYGSEYNL